MTSGSWGRLCIPGPARIVERDWRFEALPEIAGSDTVLAYGRGRSYGDSCINSHGTQLSTRRLNRFIAFDPQQGLLHAEAGLTLDDILRVIVPQGWFLPVLPGTRFVTLGGAIANDVHGKNHHLAGTFGCHVRSLTLLRSDGLRYACSPTENAQLFAATIGGLGLTGLITSAQVALIPIQSDQLAVENLAFSCLEEFGAISRESRDWEYTVSWIDTSARGPRAGRGIFSRARHARRGEGLAPGRSGLRIGVPFTPPFSLVNKRTADLFNRAWFRAGRRRRGVRLRQYRSFFFSLDAIADWNRIYGRRGFYQYQCVVPHLHAAQAVHDLLRELQRSDEASFLAVLKEFGDRRSPGLMSFPRPGLTLALDFPNRGERTRRLLEKFDETVLSAGGAVYPAKDARMPPRLFAAGYPGLQAFMSQLDPCFSSTFWRRVRE